MDKAMEMLRSEYFKENHQVFVNETWRKEAEENRDSLGKAILALGGNLVMTKDEREKYLVEAEGDSDEAA